MRITVPTGIWRRMCRPWRRQNWGPAKSRQFAPDSPSSFPAEFGALVEDRSGLALKGICTLAGVIDPGYRGELKVVLINLGKDPFRINAGDRIAQLRIIRKVEVEFREVDSVSVTERDARGFGSTGS